MILSKRLAAATLSAALFGGGAVVRADEADIRFDQGRAKELLTLGGRVGKRAEHAEGVAGWLIGRLSQVMIGASPTLLERADSLLRAAQGMRDRASEIRAETGQVVRSVEREFWTRETLDRDLVRIAFFEDSAARGVIREPIGLVQVEKRLSGLWEGLAEFEGEVRRADRVVGKRDPYLRSKR